MASQKTNGDDITKYRKIKFSFIKKCLQYVKDNDLEEQWPCTFEAITKYKEMVLEATKIMNSDRNSLTYIHRRATENYDVVRDAEQKLTLVTKNNKKVIDIFSCFDIIKEAHITDGSYHRNLEQTVHSLDGMYYIPKVAVEMFISVCTGCFCQKPVAAVTISAGASLPLPPLVKILPKPAPQIMDNNLNSSPLSKPSPLLENMLMRPAKTPILMPTATHTTTATTADARMSSNLSLPTVQDSTDEVTITGKAVTDVLSATTQHVQTVPYKDFSLFPATSGNVYTDIITSSKPDGNFRHLLIYMDIFTNYTLLRPLTKMDLKEISMELFKIFADFGVPPEIHCAPYMYTLFQKVLCTLQDEFGTNQIVQKNVIIDTKASLDQQKHQTLLLTTGRKVKNRLSLWTTKTRCDNWAIGCFVVQQNMNTQKMEINGVSNTTPYQNFFNNHNDKLKIKAIEKMSEGMPKHESKSVSEITSDPQMVVNVSANVHDTVDRNITSDIIEINEDIKEESDVIMQFEEEDTQVQFQEVANYNSRKIQSQQMNIISEKNLVEKYNLTSLHKEESNKLLEDTISIEKASLKSVQIEQIDTATILIDDEDSLEGIQDIEDQLNCVQPVPAKKPKLVVPSTKFEKKFESFAKHIDKQKKLVGARQVTAGHNKFTPPGTSKNDGEDNQMSKSDSEYPECHVCGRKLFFSQKKTFRECLQCRKSVHSMCISTTFKQKNQNVCLVCMFKDGDPDDPIDLGFGENVNKI